MLSKDRAYGIINLVLEEAKGYDTRVVVQGDQEALTRFANSEIHQNVQATRLGVTIVITSGNKRSAARTDIHTADGLRQATREAIANLDYLPDGEEQPLPVDGPPVIEEMALDQNLAQQYSAGNRARMISRTLATLESGYKAYGALTHQVNLLAVGNSRGIIRFYMGNSVYYKALVSSASGGSGYADTRSGRADDLDIPGVLNRAHEKARLNQDPEELEPGAYTVILEPLAVGDILTYLAYTGFSGKSVQDQVSFLTGKLGEKVFGENISIVDDCTNPNTAMLPFDMEGAPRRKVTIIDRGVARGLTHDTASALKEGVVTTGHAVELPLMGNMSLPLNLVMAGGDRSLDEMIAGTADGLLVTRFNYMNPVNPRTARLTALTRDGLFRIKDGKIAGAVKNLRFTESMLQALNNVEAISRERQRTRLFNLAANYYVPALKISSFHFTGKTG